MDRGLVQAPWKDVQRMFLAMLVLLVFCVLTYGERYDAKAFPISSLGGVRTANGYPNHLSAAGFIAAMANSARLMLRFSAHYASSRAALAPVFTAIGRVVAVGFVLTALPHDVPALWRPHMVGAATVFSGLGLMAVVQLRQVASLFSPAVCTALVVAIALPLLAYGGLVAVGASSEHLAQKFAAAGVTVPNVIVARRIAPRILWPDRGKTVIAPVASRRRGSAHE